jgi:uncharacterized protein YggU (UPF0235/DUF167 family)
MRGLDVLGMTLVLSAVHEHRFTARTVQGGWDRYVSSKGLSQMIRFAVRVHPGSLTSSVGGTYDGALQVRVRARAIRNAATNEVCSVLADAFGVRPSAVQCQKGARSRTKLITIEGNDDVLAGRLNSLLSST